MRLQLSVLCTAYLLGCVANLLSSPDEITPEMAYHWEVGSRWLIEEPWNVDSRAVFNVKPEHFRWKVLDVESFDCGGVEAVGCYDADTATITWVRSVPEVIAHEAGHAILERLGDRRWDCFQHEEDCPQRDP